jgi:hypothetical protein
MVLGLLLGMIRFNPCASLRDLMAGKISQGSSVNPDHRLLLLKDFLK